MTSNVGQKYVCFVPAEKADRLARAGVPNTTEMLLPLSRTCLRKVGNPREYCCNTHPCLQTTGWWTYEYCHGVSIKQLHLEGLSKRHSALKVLTLPLLFSLQNNKAERL